MAGITPYPTEAWMRQTVRNVIMAKADFLCGCRYLLPARRVNFSLEIISFCVTVPSVNRFPMHTRIQQRQKTLLSTGGQHERHTIIQTQ
jgi:hypothetical protein